MDVIAKRYEVLGVLGQGAMGRVLRVRDRVSGQEVALKQILDARSALQIRQEFRAMTRLRHVNCCQVYDYGLTEAGEPYFTMELVPGQGLDELLPLPAERFKPLFVQLLRALGHVHGLGYVHCDVKAANVRVRPDGMVKLMDFGLLAHPGRAGEIRGTVPYIAPELVRRAPIDRRVDLYAAGALAYEALSGHPPFEAATPLEVLRMHVTTPPRPLAGAPRELNEVVLRLLAKEPPERFQSAQEALRALGDASGSEGTRGLLASPMVGRSAAMAFLEGWVARLHTGRGGVVWLQGPAGVGKSRLIEELRFGVQLADLGFAVGRCERERTPYHPFVTLLRGLLPACRADAAEVLERVSPVLVALLPELGVAPAEEMDTPAKQKLRLHAAVAELLLAIATHRPVVVAIEDAHLVDPLSLELGAYLRRTMTRVPFLMLVASRDTDLVGQADANLTLEPLDAAAQAELLSAMLGGPADLGGQAEVTAGIPLHMLRLLQHLDREGLLVQGEDGVWRTTRPLAALDLPHDLHGFAVHKLALLGNAARALARAAAVVGPVFTLAVLREVAELDDERLLEAVTELEDQAVVFRRESDQWGFADESAIAVLADELAPAERVRLHARTAEALLEGRERAWELPLALAGRVAEHLVQAGAPAGRVLPFLLDAGQRHARLLSNAEAERYLRAGLALLPAPGHGASALPDGEAWRLALLSAIGDVERVTGRAREAAATLGQAVALAETAGEAACLRQLLPSLAKALQVIDDYPAALAHATRAVTACEQVGDLAGAARALLVASRLRFFGGHPAEALAAAERALALARAGEAGATVGQAGAWLGFLCVSQDRMVEGIQHLHASARLLEAAHDELALNNCLSLLGNAEMTRGDYRGARDWFERNRDLCQRIGYGNEEAFARVNLGIACTRLGAYAEAHAELAEAARLAEQQQARYPLALARAYQALGQAHLGRPDLAVAGCDEALALAEASGNAYAVTLTRQLRIEALLLAGRCPEALAEAEALAPAFADGAHEESRAQLLVLRARLLAAAPHGAAPAPSRAQGRLAEATAAAGEALAIARTRGLRGLQADALAALAGAALREEAWEAAEAHAREALALTKLIGAEPLEAELLAIAGETALATGRPAAATFEALAALAGRMQTPAFAAQAAFGRAAAAPYAPPAASLAQEARARLEQLPIAPAAWPPFAARRELARVLEGNHIGFGLKRTKQRRKSGRLREGLPDHFGL